VRKHGGNRPRSRVSGTSISCCGIAVEAAVDPRQDVRGQEGHLFCLGKEVVGVAVQLHPPDDPERHHLFGDQLGRVQHIMGQAVGQRLIENLHGQIPFREIARGDGLIPKPCRAGHQPG
jgi:hypothetical protein